VRVAEEARLSDSWPYLTLFAAGSFAGVLNVVAGGGSFLTLPLLIFLGLPPTVANGTNRVAILMQNTGSVWSFHRHGLLRRGWIVLAAVPATGGAVLGTLAALRVGDASFRKILAGLMVAVSLWALWDPLGTRRPDRGPGPELHSRPELGGGRHAAVILGFFLVGIYSGFVQAGAGFLILAVTALAGLDLVRANALKATIVLVFTPLALGLFVAAGKVNWAMGAALGCGNLLGGLVGVRLTVVRGHRWVQRVVTVAIVAFAIKLWIAP